MSGKSLARVPWTIQARTFARRHLKQLARNKMILFITVAWPVLWYLLTMELFVDASTEEQLGYIKASNGMNFGMFGAFTVTVAVFAGEFARDIDGDRYQKFRSMPIRPTADLAGRLVAGASLGVASYLVTIGFAYLHGATFQLPGPKAIGVILLTLVLFCLIAMSLAMVLALVISKPEHMTTIAVITVLMAFFVTGYNGTVPELVAENTVIINYLPNSLAARMQITGWAGVDNVGFMTPPEAPYSLPYAGLLVGYSAVMLLISIVIIDRFAYKMD